MWRECVQLETREEEKTAEKESCHESNRNCRFHQRVGWDVNNSMSVFRILNRKPNWAQVFNCVQQINDNSPQYIRPKKFKTLFNCVTCWMYYWFHASTVSNEYQTKWHQFSILIEIIGFVVPLILHRCCCPILPFHVPSYANRYWQ